MKDLKKSLCKEKTRRRIYTNYERGEKHVETVMATFIAVKESKELEEQVLGKMARVKMLCKEYQPTLGYFCTILLFRNAQVSGMLLSIIREYSI